MNVRLLIFIFAILAIGCNSDNKTKTITLEKDKQNTISILKEFPYAKQIESIATGCLAFKFQREMLGKTVYGDFFIENVYQKNGKYYLIGNSINSNFEDVILNCEIAEEEILKFENVNKLFISCFLVILVENVEFIPIKIEAVTSEENISLDIDCSIKPQSSFLVSGKINKIILGD